MAMKIHFMWVGQGDCTIIETNAGQADGKIIMIDCGSVSGVDYIYPLNIKEKLTKIMNSYPKIAGKNRKELDNLFITHPDRDHYNMVTRMLKDFGAKSIYYGGLKKDYTEGTKAYGDLQDILPDIKKLKSYYFNVNANNLQVGTNSSDFKLWILSVNYPFDGEVPITKTSKKINELNVKNKNASTNPANFKSNLDCNGCSIVILIKYGEHFQAMFTGDATIHQQKKIKEKRDKRLGTNPKNYPILSLKSKLFKMSHHGSKESCAIDFTNNTVEPDAMVASAAMVHPHPDYNCIDSIDLERTENNTQHEYVCYIDGEEDQIVGGKRKRVQVSKHQNMVTTFRMYNTHVSFRSVSDYAKDHPDDMTIYDNGSMMNGDNRIFTVEKNGNYQVTTSNGLILHSSYKEDKANTKKIKVSNK